MFLHLPLYLMTILKKVTANELKIAFSENGKVPHPLNDLGKPAVQFLEGHIKNDISILFT